jgi:predicted membrane protein
LEMHWRLGFWQKWHDSRYNQVQSKIDEISTPMTSRYHVLTITLESLLVPREQKCITFLVAILRFIFNIIKSLCAIWCF